MGRESFYPTAVFNPLTAARDYVGAVLNALLSGGQFGANRLLQQLSKTRDEYLDLFKKQQGNQKLTGKSPDELIKSDWNNPGKGPEYIKLPNPAVEDATLVSALVKDYTGNTEQPPKADARDKLSQEITASWYGTGAEASHGTGNVVKAGSFDDLPNTAKNTYKGYDSNGWKGNFSGQTPGTNAGRAWGNELGDLPTIDHSMNQITYREFDVNNRISGTSRDSERFIVGSDGSIYYTPDHYGTFIRIQ